MAPQMLQPGLSSHGWHTTVAPQAAPCAGPTWLPREIVLGTSEGKPWLLTRGVPHGLRVCRCSSSALLLQWVRGEARSSTLPSHMTDPIPCYNNLVPCSAAMNGMN